MIHRNEKSSIYQGTLDPGWLLGLATIVALASLSRALSQTDIRLPIVNSPAASDTGTAASQQELPPLQMPTIDSSQPLSVAEIRWCMSQQVAFDAMQPILGTQGAIDYYNELGDDFNLRCSARQYSEGDGNEATRSVDRARERIAAAAIEDIQRLNDQELTLRVQKILELLGYQVAVDGVYGEQTQKVIRGFQLRAGMPADGLVSQPLLDRLKLVHMRTLTGRQGSRSPSE